jgi:hypothetical protein
MKQKFDSRKWISSSFTEWPSLFCDLLHVQYDLQWNVSSINKSNIPFIFMGVRRGEYLVWEGGRKRGVQKIL